LINAAYSAVKNKERRGMKDEWELVWVYISLMVKGNDNGRSRMGREGREGRREERERKREGREGRREERRYGGRQMGKRQI